LAWLKFLWGKKDYSLVKPGTKEFWLPFLKKAGLGPFGNRKLGIFWSLGLLAMLDFQARDTGGLLPVRLG